MNIAICNETFRDWSMERSFAYAGQLGYDGIEIAPFTIAKSAFDISAKQCRQIRRLAATHGLEIVGVHWLLAGTTGLLLTSRESGVRRKTAQYLRQLVEVCSDMGGRVMVFGSPGQRNLAPGISSLQGMEFAADVIRETIPALQTHGVVLALEPLGPEETNFLTTAAETRQLIQIIDSPWVRLHLDVKAMSTEADPVPQIIRNNADLLAHFHCNDPNRRGPGMGDVEFVPILDALLEMNYPGWLSVEVFDESVSPQELAEQSLRCLRESLRGSVS